MMQPYSFHQIPKIAYSASRLTSNVLPVPSMIQVFYHPDESLDEETEVTNEAREWRRGSTGSAISEVIIHTHWNPCATLSA